MDDSSTFDEEGGRSTGPFSNHESGNRGAAKQGLDTRHSTLETDLSTCFAGLFQPVWGNSRLAVATDMWGRSVRR
ncbi:hypothetical protein SERLA73DRAFT_132034 [Serpula lacrymans var. lacrymans S7.3]|uniref:Uncharacterized protein n=2 Tax=Serpula lacrymans var. lacrymans TaxID=341189 RepID=F8PQQ7_SERL3|nr:uncharacterized protein SERLADRAFT_381796 [Serpula lacrymans var. lacrymans S7.9]EGO01617.1 hypothetical protein SERLA73DRAFT_132034 [Serpula lacrymans var. lacrymans S7.3]EGO27271.1 hypothetical protein SERLADRAFT_381796 [Serpula lacrymans var. lacrymans S7.9]